MLQLHNELYNISKFNNEIDFDEGLKLGDVYGNYAELAKAQTEQNLKKWVKLIAQFHRRITNVPNIIGGSLEYYQTKEEMVNSILTYITININYFKRVLNFDVIVGMTDLKIYIHYRELSELKSISKKLYQYYQIKMFRIRQYHEELLKMDFDEWSEKTTNENIFKLFIYKVLSIFPELNIRSVFDEVVSYTDFTENVSIKNFTKYIIQYYLDKPEFIDITYKMIRYVNATFPTRSRRMIVPEETTNSTILQYLIQMFSESKILSNNWNFARFCLGFDYLLFGGVIPFINRLDNNKMKELFLKFDSLFPKEQLSKTYYNFDNLSHDQREAVIFNITSNHIEYREYSRIRNLLTFKKVSEVTNGTIDFENTEKNKMITYALVAEYFIRGNNKTEEYGSIFKYVQDLTIVELENFIANSYEIWKDHVGSIFDFDLQANINYLSSSNCYLVK